MPVPDQTPAPRVAGRAPATGDPGQHAAAPGQGAHLDAAVDPKRYVEAQVARDRFTVDHVLGLWGPTGRVPLHLSPDGRHLALSARLPRRGSPLGEDQSFDAAGVPAEAIGSRVLVVDTATGAVRAPFPDGGTSWGGQWSPDGTRLAAYVQHEGAACLGVWDAAGGAVRLRRDAPVRPFFGFEVPRWTPDGRAVVVKLVASAGSGPAVRPPDGERTASGVSVFSFDPQAPPGVARPPDWADRYRCDLARVDVATGEAVRLAAGWSLVGWRIAPDGRTVAVLRYTETDWTKQQLYFDLTVLPPHGAPSRVLARRVACGLCFSWSPDGRRIAYSTSERGQPVRVFVVPADGAHEPAELTDGQDAGLEDEYEAPRWDPGGEHVYCLGWRGLGVFAADATARRRVAVPEQYEVLGWAQRPTDALCRTADGAVVHLLRDAVTQNLVVARTALEGGRTTVLAELPKRWCERAFGVDVAPGGDRVYLTLEAAEHPAEVWQLDGRAGEPRRLAALNPDVRDLALGASRLVEWRSSDGAVRRGALVLPPGYAEGQRVPVVVDVYLGRMGSRSLHQFGGGGSVVHAQVLASRGYAVLNPDMPAVDRDPLRRVPGQVLPALDRLVELGIADPARLGAVGHSYGGYCVQALLTQTGRLRAAVCSAGATNLTSAYGGLSRDGHSMELGWLETARAGMGGPLWERRDAYVENSPLFHLDRVTTPLLLVCGDANPGEVAQAGEAFSALRRLGQRVELRVYRGEGHRIGTWSEASYRDLCDRVLAWFDTFLTGR